MKKWYFSKEGEVSGPLGLEEAKSYATQNPDDYAWHPSFIQWKPITSIIELGPVVSEKAPTIHLLDEIKEKFKIKRQRLEKKIKVIEERRANNESLLAALESEIALYKKLTANLSDGVKGAINPIEQKFNSLTEKQSKLNEAASISSMELDALINEFTARMSGQATPKAKAQPAAEQTEEIAIDNVDESLLEQFAENVTAKQSEPATDKSKTVKLVDVNAEKHSEASNTAKADSRDVLIEDVEDSSDESDDKKSIAGVKSLFKSVFKSDEQEDPSEVNSLSKLLAMEEESKQAVNESPIQAPTAASDDESDRKAKRRTRRRR